MYKLNFGERFAQFWVVLKRSDSNGWCANWTLVIYLWSGNINGLLIPSSSPHRFHERNLSVLRHLKEYLFYRCGQISNVCFHEAPRYHVCHKYMVFVKISHGTQKYQKCHFLEYKKDRFELVFESIFCQLHVDVFTKC